MGIVEDIGAGPICLDTCIFIYFIEENSSFIKPVVSIFEALDEECVRAVTSEITLLETLVIPIRAKDEALANSYEQILSQSNGLKLVSLDKTLLRRAAYLRANLNLKTPDAIQIAAAQQENCKIFITNDRRLPPVADLRILQLSDYCNE